VRRAASPIREWISVDVVDGKNAPNRFEGHGLAAASAPRDPSAVGLPLDQVQAEAIVSDEDHLSDRGNSLVVVQFFTAIVVLVVVQFFTAIVVLGARAQNFDECVFRCIRSAVPGACDQDSGHPIRLRSEATSTGLVRRWVEPRVGVSDLSGGAWMSRAG